MRRELTKGPNGHYDRNQWVLSGIVEDRPRHNQAFWCSFLWDHGTPFEVGGITEHQDPDEYRLQHVNKEVRLIRLNIVECLKRGVNFSVGPVQVDFVSENGGEVHKIAVYRDIEDGPHIEIDFTFSDSWEPGELLERVDDAMMEAAAFDPDETPESTLTEPTLAELLVAAWNNPRRQLTIDQAEQWVTIFGNDVVSTIIRKIEQSTMLPSEAEANRPPASAAQLERIRAMHASDSIDVNIDDDAVISQADNGVWVSGWLWLPDKS